MQQEVLAFFQKELQSSIASIEKVLPFLGKDSKAGVELSRIFHAIKGASALLKIESLRRMSLLFERLLSEDSFNEEVKEATLEYIALLKDVASVEEDRFLECIETKEELFRVLEGKLCGKKLTESDNAVALFRLKEIMDVFQQHLTYCETHFDDTERLMLLEESAAAIRELGKESGISLVQEAGKALNLCFFAARKKLLGWTRGHFDLITEVATVLMNFSLHDEKWLRKHQKNIETCTSIILAISNEATQFAKPNIEVEETFKRIDEKTSRFLKLFLVELSDQMKDFEGDLLLLEKEPGNKKIAARLMRASHSLKGAAKIVEFQALTRLAHAMEDVFAYVQKGEGEISLEEIDALLKAADILNSLSKIEAGVLSEWILSNKGIIEQAINNLSSASSSLKDKPLVIQQISKVRDVPHQVDDKRFLRVSLSHINQLMGIAGEFLVEVKTLETAERGISKLKVKAGGLVTDLERLVERLKTEALSQTIGVASDLLTSAKNYAAEISLFTEDFERVARHSETLSTKFYHEMVQSRMRPFSEGTDFLPRLIRDLCKQLGKKAELEIHGKDTLVDREILEKLETPLTHLVRNALDHGIEPESERVHKGKDSKGVVKVEATHRSGSLVISISDDGGGIDLNALKRAIFEKKLGSESVIETLSEESLLSYLYHPGFSTAKQVTDYSGRGIGLNIVESTVEQLGGKISISREGGTCFTLTLPLTLSIIRALIVKIGGQPYAFPLSKIKKVLYLSQEEILEIEGCECFKEGDVNIGLIPCSQVLKLEATPSLQERIPVIVINDEKNDYGIAVESFISEREIAIHELDKKLGKMETISAGSFMEDGTPLLIIDVEGLRKCIDRFISQNSTLHIREKGVPKKILIVDDSPLVRETLKSLLLNKGFSTLQAKGGEEALLQINRENFDLIITDIDMPNLNGLELIHLIRNGMQNKNTPIIVLSYKEESTLKEFMKRHKVEHFFSKNQFKDGSFLETIKGLIHA